MPRRTIFLTVVFLCFGLGLFKLLLMRFETGDIYPAYSTLRSDPLGAKALYLALQHLNALSVERHFQSADKIVMNAGTVLFIVGLSHRELDTADPEFLHLVRSLKMNGGRLVLAFYPKGPKGKPEASGSEAEPKADSSSPEEACGKQSQKSPTGPKSIRKKCPAAQGQPGIAGAEYLGFAFEHSPRQERKGGKLAAVRVDDKMEAQIGALTAIPELPQSIPWHSALYFQPKHSDWRTLYATPKEAPVVMARKLGRGEIIVLSDPYLFSNEAMRSGRESALLAWLVQGKSRILFDEAHLGNIRSLGVADLLLRYRFYGLLPALVLLGILLIWKNSAVFIPHQTGRPVQDSNEYTSTRDYTQGLVSLLRRHIPPRRILTAGFQEWLKSSAAGRRVPQEKLEKVKTLMTEHAGASGRGMEPLQTYCAISKILSERGKP